MGPWWLYLLVFVFGYLTCKTFYFIKEVRLGLVMVKISQSISLYCLVKGIEQLEYAKGMKKAEMLRAGETDKNVKIYSTNFDLLIDSYKTKAINDIIQLHPEFYRDVIKFNDWNSAMIYLNTEGREYLQTFTKEVKND